MNNFETAGFAKPYSHIYVEKQVIDAPKTQRILAKFSDAAMIPIDSYKQIFNRPRQQFALQKKSAKLILAKKQPPYVQPFSENCQTTGFTNPIYVTPALGCVYDCDFCFLHGMYNSANLVIFINAEEIQNAVVAEQTRRVNAPLWVSISYETDLLALEHMGDLIPSWVSLAEEHPNLYIECRTRSGIGAFRRIAHLAPPPNFILAWSLSPPKHAERYEHSAPTIEQRLRAAKVAIDAGWSARLCFDPVLNLSRTVESFEQLFALTFSTLPAEKLYDVTIGPFRMGSDFFKRIKKARPYCDLFYTEYELEPEVFSNGILKSLEKHISRERINLWQSQS